MSQIFGIAGPPGSGKTTLVKAMSRSFEEASVIFFDHYQTLVQKSPEEMLIWLDAGADYNTFQLPQLATDLASLKQGKAIKNPVNGKTIEATPVVFFETLFGRAHYATGQYIDYLIWIDTPLDIAFARTVKAANALIQTRINSSRSSKGEIIDLQAHFRWLNIYVENYIQFVSKTLHLQLQQIKPAADFHLSGIDDTKEIQVRARQFIKDSQHR